MWMLEGVIRVRPTPTHLWVRGIAGIVRSLWRKEHIRTTRLVVMLSFGRIEKHRVHRIRSDTDTKRNLPTPLGSDVRTSGGQGGEWEPPLEKQAGVEAQVSGRRVAIRFRTYLWRFEHQWTNAQATPSLLHLPSLDRKAVLLKSSIARLMHHLRNHVCKTLSVRGSLPQAEIDRARTPSK